MWLLFKMMWFWGKGPLQKTECVLLWPRREGGKSIVYASSLDVIDVIVYFQCAAIGPRGLYMTLFLAILLHNTDYLHKLHLLCFRAIYSQKLAFLLSPRNWGLDLYITIIVCLSGCPFPPKRLLDFIIIY